MRIVIMDNTQKEKSTINSVNSGSFSSDGDREEEDLGSLFADLKSKIQESLCRLVSTDKKHLDVWIIESLSSRQHFKGIKMRIRWRDQATNMMVRLKFCLPNSTDRKKISLDSYLIQLEDINFKVPSEKQLNFYKRLQCSLDMEVKEMLQYSKAHSIQDKAWIDQLFPKIGVILREELGKVSKISYQQLISLPKQKVNYNYMLTPPLATFAWNPKGFVFLVENSQAANISGSLMGNKSMMNMIFPPQRIQKQTSFCYRPVAIPLEAKKPYDWNTKEEYNFLDQKIQLDEIQGMDQYATQKNQNQRLRSLSVACKSFNQIQNFNTQAKDLPQARRLELIGYPKLFKIQYGLSRIQKDIKQLITQLNEGQQEVFNILQVLLSGHGHSYQNICKEKILGPFQIKIIQKIFTQSLSKKNDYKSFLRAVMAETQCNHSMVINSFNASLCRLGAAPKYQDKLWILHQHLVSYNDFDQYEFNEVLMLIMEIYLIRLDTSVPQKLYISNTLFSDQMSMYTRNLPYISKVDYVEFVSDPQYTRLTKEFIMLYEIRSRDFGFMEYNKIMRILSANQRLRSCVKATNRLIQSSAVHDISFLKEMVKEYKIQRKLLKQRNVKRGKRRAWKIFCPKCKHQTNTNEVFENDFVCSSCRTSCVQ